MPEFCAQCGFIIRTEVKHYDGDSFDTRCHRLVITTAFEAISYGIRTLVGAYFANTGAERDYFRKELRELIADYRQLSY